MVYCFMQGKEPGWDLWNGSSSEFREGSIWNGSSQRESIRSIHKQNPLLNAVWMGCITGKESWSLRSNMIPYGVRFIFQIWLKQCSPDNLNTFYIITQFWHFFCSIFHILNDALQSPIQWMFLSCLAYIGSSYAPTIFTVLGVLWPHTFQMYDVQTLSPYLLHSWNPLPPR